VSPTEVIDDPQRRSRKPLPAVPRRRWRAGLARTASWIAGSSGWKRRGVAFLAGALSVLAMAPFFLWPILFATLPVMVWLIDGSARDGAMRSRLGRAARDGWWFGFGYFFFGLFWIGEAFLVEAEIFGWLLPFAVTLMPAGLAFFTAVIAASACSLWQPGLSRVAVLAVCFGLGEWLRGHIFTGFPWNVLGYALTEPLELMQAVSIVGIYGLTLLVVLIAATPLVVLADLKTSRTAGKITAVTLMPLASLFAYGAAVLSSGPNPSVEGVKLRIVQPSIPQNEKWLAEHQQRIFAEHLRLSGQDPSGTRDDLAGITHVFWPEAAMPFLPLSNPQALALIGEMLPEQTFLIAGVLRLETAEVGDELRPGEQPVRRVFNSLVAFGSDGQPAEIYDKIHLVPFGEYLPFQEFLEWIGLESLTRVRGGFAIGDQPRSLFEVPGLTPFSPLICYEAIFPAVVVQGKERPGLIVNATNDGWFGNTTGPYQHMHQARVRAVEEGVPLLRVANNGISAMIDPFGRVLGKLALNEAGTLDASLPEPRPATPYARFGDAIFAAGVLLLLLLILVATVRSRRSDAHRLL